MKWYRCDEWLPPLAEENDYSVWVLLAFRDGFAVGCYQFDWEYDSETHLEVRNVWTTQGKWYTEGDDGTPIYWAFLPTSMPPPPSIERISTHKKTLFEPPIWREDEDWQKALATQKEEHRIFWRELERSDKERRKKKSEEKEEEVNGTESSP